VAFDKRPVLGGKVVVQDKRYRHTVGVSAVRDLFGTMMNEAANKGILVTTSGYGRMLTSLLRTNRSSSSMAADSFICLNKLARRRGSTFRRRSDAGSFEKADRYLRSSSTNSHLHFVYEILDRLLLKVRANYAYGQSESSHLLCPAPGHRTNSVAAESNVRHAIFGHITIDLLV
jgi:restriction endonuclease Mrr